MYTDSCAPPSYNYSFQAGEDEDTQTSVQPPEPERLVLEFGRESPQQAAAQQCRPRPQPGTTAQNYSSPGGEDEETMTSTQPRQRDAFTLEYPPIAPTTDQQLAAEFERSWAQAQASYALQPAVPHGTGAALGAGLSTGLALYCGVPVVGVVAIGAAFGDTLEQGLNIHNSRQGRLDLNEAGVAGVGGVAGSIAGQGLGKLAGPLLTSTLRGLGSAGSWAVDRLESALLSAGERVAANEAAAGTAIVARQTAGNALTSAGMDASTVNVTAADGVFTYQYAMNLTTGEVAKTVSLGPMATTSAGGAQSGFVASVGSPVTAAQARTLGRLNALFDDLSVTRWSGPPIPTNPMDDPAYLGHLFKKAAAPAGEFFSRWPNAQTMYSSLSGQEATASTGAFFSRWPNAQTMYSSLSGQEATSSMTVNLTAPGAASGAAVAVNHPAETPRR